MIENLADVQSALADGWEVEPPVCVTTDPLRRRRALLQFILWRDGRPRVASLEDGQDLRRWIDEKRWPVVSLR